MLVWSVLNKISTGRVLTQSTRFRKCIIPHFPLSQQKCLLECHRSRIPREFFRLSYGVRDWQTDLQILNIQLTFFHPEEAPLIICLILQSKMRFPVDIEQHTFLITKLHRFADTDTLIILSAFVFLKHQTSF